MTHKRGDDMKFLTETQIQLCAAEQLAAEVADKAEYLQRKARDAGLIVEIRSVADLFSVVTVRQCDPYAMANHPTVPA